MSPRARLHLCAVAFALSAAVSAGCGGARSGPRPAGVLLITVAGLRADRTNLHLYERPTTWTPSTPEERARGEDLSLDAIAAQGVVFAHAYAPSGSAAASLTALHSGRHPLETCVFDATDEVSRDVPLLAERFQAAGFRTAVRAAGLELDAETGLGRGFEPGPPAPADDEAAVASAQAWLADLGSDEGFFLWLHLRGPTASVDANAPNPSYDEALARTSVRLRGFFRFLAGLDGSPVDRLPTTAVVVTGPYGMQLGERGEVGHRRALHAEGLHVPLILRHPPSVTGRRVFGGVAALERVAPTLADWCGLPDEEGAASLFELIDDDDSAHDAQVAVRGASGLALRTAERTLIVEMVGGAEAGSSEAQMRVFDTRADPREVHDLAPVRPDEVRQLLERLRAAIEPFRSACLAPALAEALSGP